MYRNNSEIIENIEGLKEFEETLNYISEERVFAIETYKGTMFIGENCDAYFSVDLTPKICEDLSKVFKILGEYIEKGGRLNEI